MDSKDAEKQEGPKKGKFGQDISMRFYDNYTRTIDAMRKSLDAVRESYNEQDKVVNFGIGHVEDKVPVPTCSKYFHFA
jgi:hypothetical protein